MTTILNKKEQQIEGMFDAIAPRYDFLNRLLSLRQDQRWREQAVRYLKAGSYLDVATGTGDMIQVAQRRRPHLLDSIQGVDISEQMLERARKKCPTIPFQKASAMALPFDDTSFTNISVAFGIRNFEDLDQGLSELSRVLEKNGRLIILEFFPSRSQEKGITRFFKKYLALVLPKIASFFSSKEAYQYLPQSIFSFLTASALIEKLGQQGLNVHVQKKFIFGYCDLLVFEKISD